MFGKYLLGNIFRLCCGSIEACYSMFANAIPYANQTVAIYFHIIQINWSYLQVVSERNRIFSRNRNRIVVSYKHVSILRSTLESSTYSQYAKIQRFSFDFLSLQLFYRLDNKLIRMRNYSRVSARPKIRTKIGRTRNYIFLQSLAETEPDTIYKHSQKKIQSTHFFIIPQVGDSTRMGSLSEAARGNQTIEFYCCCLFDQPPTLKN